MNWAWPQLATAGLYVLSLGVMLGLNGQPKTGKHSFGILLVSVGLMVWLLYMGGFWTVGDK